MERKGLVYLAVCMVLVFTLVLGGCAAGTGKTETTAAATGTTSVPEAAKEALKPVELTWYMGAGAVPSDEARTLVEQEMNKTLQEKINATIKLNFISFGEYADKMNITFAAGENFDLCFAASWMGYFDLAQKGAYADLTDLLPQYAPDYAKIPASFVIDSCKVNGKLLGTPNLQGMAMPKKLCVRADLYDKYNAPAQINTLEDLDVFFDAIKNGEKDVVPMAFYGQNGGSNSGYYILTKMGLPDAGDGTPGYIVYDAEKGAKVVDYYTSEQYVEWLKWAGKAYQNGWLEKNAPTVTTIDRTLMDSGKYASIFDGAGPQLEALNSKSTNYNWKYIDMGAKPMISSGQASASMTSINFNSENKERAMMLINLINTDVKLYNTLCYGVEGTHFILKDGFREFPEGVTAEKSPYNPDAAWAYGNSFNAYQLKGSDPDSYKKQLELDQSAAPAPAFGFTFDGSPYTTEIAQAAAVLNEYCIAMESGSVDYETYYPKFLEKLKKSGYYKVIEAKQKALDEFLAAQK